MAYRYLRHSITDAAICLRYSLCCIINRKYKISNIHKHEDCTYIQYVFIRVRDCTSSLYLSWIFVNTFVIGTSNYQLIYRFLTTQRYLLLLFYYLSYYDVYNIIIGIIYWPISYRESILLKITCTYVYGVIIFDLTGERP